MYMVYVYHISEDEKHDPWDVDRENANGTHKLNGAREGQMYKMTYTHHHRHI
jgi:hypothetical protein